MTSKTVICLLKEKRKEEVPPGELTSHICKFRGGGQLWGGGKFAILRVRTYDFIRVVTFDFIKAKIAILGRGPTLEGFAILKVGQRQGGGDHLPGGRVS